MVYKEVNNSVEITMQSTNNAWLKTEESRKRQLAQWLALTQLVVIGLKAKRFQQEAAFGSQVMLKGGFSDSSVGKESAYNVGELGSIPGSGRSPGEGNGNPLQYSCLENPMDRGAWQATVHGVARVRHDLVTKERELILQSLFSFFKSRWSN